ncbi:hypothetical protein ACET9Q_20860 [Aeromonas caviae]|uniref:hypothetical protein n=1 Tax=Aeromonas caviae TaxID=648 RepID=UPI0038CF5CCF
MSKQPKDNAPKPLHTYEYCTVDRAARLLECEVEDILHWAELGCINIYINFDREFSYYCPRVKIREGVMKGDLIHANFGFRFSLSGRPARKENIAPQRPIKPTLRTLPKPYPTVPSPWILHGLWGIAFCDTSWYIEQYLSGIPFNEAIQVFAEQNRIRGAVSYDAHAFIRLKDGLMPPIPWLIYEDLELLQQCIHSGKKPTIKELISSSLYEKTETAPVTIPKRHGNTAVNDKKRQAIIKAALKLLEQSPELRGSTAASWGREVVDLEAQLFEDGKCPGELRTVQNTIKKAIDAGVLPSFR